MKHALLLLLLSAALVFGADTLEQKLSERRLPIPRHPPGQTITQAFAALSADYQKHHREPLRIYLAVELTQPPNPKVPPPSKEEEPSKTRIDTGPLEVPVIEILRYLTHLSSTTFTIRDDIILIQAAPK